MIIVSGWLRVAAEARDDYLEGCRVVIEAARKAPGCLGFYLAPDPLDPERINVFEQWADVESVERFRGSGPTGEQQAQILEAKVEQHEIAGTTPPT